MPIIPLAGGMLTGKHRNFIEKPQAGRFDNNAPYQSRYWKSDYFAALEDLTGVCARHGITPTQAALRWLCHHSCLSSDWSDSIILGASKIQHLKENMSAASGDSLNAEILDALDRGWGIVKSDCFKYFRA